MEVIKTDLKDCFVIKPAVFGDHRGYFLQTYSEKELKEHGIDVHFVQGNRSMSTVKDTIRGLHWQKPPYTQAKLVSCTRGAVLDVVVDLRNDSPSFGKWFSVELSEENFTQLFVPRGFAHGFKTLTDNVIFEYQVDNIYHKDSEAGLLWNDPTLNIDWLTTDFEPILSDKDKVHPIFDRNNVYFKGEF